MTDTYTPRVNESILQGLRALTDVTIAEQTADAMDYTAAELDDLVGRKVEEAPFSGDALARIVRARRGVARATGNVDSYENITDDADFGLWGASSWPTRERGTSDRRLVMLGYAGRLPSQRIVPTPGLFNTVERGGFDY